MEKFVKQALSTSKSIQAAVNEIHTPPEEPSRPNRSSLIPYSIVKGTRGYIELLTNQINGTYNNGWHDACAVMMRRLIETLIIEMFENYGLSAKIKNTKGEFYYLSELIEHVLSEPSWSLSRNVRSCLPQLKGLGDKSAHSRRYNARRQDIDRVASDVRHVVEEFIHIANLK